MAISCAAAGGALAPGRPALIYNVSPSVPVGLYVRSAAPLILGTYVTVRAAAVAPAYARIRHFSGSRNWFIKRIAATAGTIVCAHGDEVVVGVRTLKRLAHDHLGRLLPAWHGCRMLDADEFFLLGDSADSFDSRYWGPVRAHQVEAVWSPLYLEHGRH